MPDDTPDDPPRRNFYGRIRGKTLKPNQRRRLSDDLGPLTPAGIRPSENPARMPLDMGALTQGRPLWLEIGFGGGEHMVHQAAANPDVTILGCEPFINGVAMLLGKIDAAGVTNVQVYPGDVRDLFEVLPDASVARAFLLYPDPWPKTRHHRRRFVTPQYLEPLARVLVPGAKFRVATDIPDYVRQTMAQVPRAGFDCLTPAPADRVTPWEDWISTRYELKALRERRRPHYLTFRKG
jgi:tRNA (guanine-N7-)-methyltransferase